MPAVAEAPPADPAAKFAALRASRAKGKAAPVVPPPAAALQLRHEVAVELIDAAPHQARTLFDGLDELAASIRQVGVLHSLLVRRGEDGRAVLVDGERRLRASKMAGRPSVPVLWFDEAESTAGAEDLESRAAAAGFAANFNGRSLNPVEQCRAMEDLKARGYKQVEIAAMGGMPESEVSRILALPRLPERLRALVAGREIGVRVAVGLLDLCDTPGVAEAIVAAVEGGGAVPHDKEERDAWLREILYRDSEWRTVFEGGGEPELTDAQRKDLGEAGALNLGGWQRWIAGEEADWETIESVRTEVREAGGKPAPPAAEDDEDLDEEPTPAAEEEETDEEPGESGLCLLEEEDVGDDDPTPRPPSIAKSTPKADPRPEPVAGVAPQPIEPPAEPADRAPDAAALGEYLWEWRLRVAADRLEDDGLTVPQILAATAPLAFSDAGGWVAALQLAMGCRGEDLDDRAATAAIASRAAASPKGMADAFAAATAKALRAAVDEDFSAIGPAAAKSIAQACGVVVGKHWSPDAAFLDLYAGEPLREIVAEIAGGTTGALKKLAGEMLGGETPASDQAVRDWALGLAQTTAPAALTVASIADPEA